MHPAKVFRNGCKGGRRYLDLGSKIFKDCPNCKDPGYKDKCLANVEDGSRDLSERLATAVYLRRSSEWKVEL